VPLAIAAFWVSNDLAKVILGITAFLCVWFAAYEAWKTERESATEVEEQTLRKESPDSAKLSGPKDQKGKLGTRSLACLWLTGG